MLSHIYNIVAIITIIGRTSDMPQNKKSGETPLDLM
jgi:hypothetical protein